MDGTAEGGSAAAVAAAGADLKHLELINCLLRADYEQQQQPAGVSNDQQIVKALRDTLAPHLTSLTALQVNGGAASLQSSLQQHISSMTSLQELSLAHTGTAGRQDIAVTVPFRILFGSGVVRHWRKHALPLLSGWSCWSTAQQTRQHSHQS
jgi:hypothetical protein